MNKNIHNVMQARLYLLENIKDLSTESFNEIPAGFNNNIIWNMGHLIAAQQGICYVRAGIATAIEEQYLVAYRPGTKPSGVVEDVAINTIKSLLLTSLDKFDEDYTNNMFDKYVPWTTRYGVDLSNIDDAISFLSYHEGLHAGYIMAIKKLVK